MMDNLSNIVSNVALYNESKLKILEQLLFNLPDILHIKTYYTLLTL